MSLNPKRTVAELKELRALTGDENGAQRVAWTDTWLKGREWFASKVKELPVEQHHDAAGNSWVTLRGASEKSLLIGGHLDSVPNGGWLDGSLNELAGLEVLRRIALDFQGHPPVTVRLVDWADEEGARFGRSLLGSSAFAGTHSIEADRSRSDHDGVKLEAGYRLDLVVEDTVVVELKAIEALAPIHQAQIISYLKLSGKPIGLLINFHTLHLKDGIKRFVI